VFFFRCVGNNRVSRTEVIKAYAAIFVVDHEVVPYSVVESALAKHYPCFCIAFNEIRYHKIVLRGFLGTYATAKIETYFAVPNNLVGNGLVSRVGKVEPDALVAIPYHFVGYDFVPIIGRIELDACILVPYDLVGDD